MADRYDAVIVGAGINGLVAAVELARAGRRVALVDRAERIGGFIASDAVSDPGFIHDTYSSWHPLFVTGGAYAAIGTDLHRHGLRYANVTDAGAPLFASVAASGELSLAYRDGVLTAESLASEADRAAYRSMVEQTTSLLDIMGAVLGSELRDGRRAREAVALLRRSGRSGVEGLVRDLATSGRAYARRHYEGAEVDHLWAPWLLHAGLSPDSAGGGLMLPLFAATMHGAGLPVVEGGAGQFLAAFEALLEEVGVRVLLETAVETIRVVDGRVAGVVADGEMLEAPLVLAGVAPSALYHDLLRDVPGLTEQRREAGQYRSGRAAMQLHVALSRPPAWGESVLGSTPLIHLSDGSASTGVACAEAEAGLLPRDPTVVVGQQFVLDPSRVPPGAASLWIQLQEVPFAPSGDAAGELDVQDGWSSELATAYADRVLAKVERHAPGLRSTVTSLHVITPSDLARANPNATHGDPYGGSLELDQNLFWRPGPRSSRHQTAVTGLWHIGAATHPGPGLGGASGHLAVQEIVAPSLRERAVDRVRSLRIPTSR